MPQVLLQLQHDGLQPQTGLCGLLLEDPSLLTMLKVAAQYAAACDAGVPGFQC